jgi:mannosylglucosylglycerate synthase
MRVAIAHFTAPPVAGGAEAIIRQHARLLASHGHDVTIVAGRGRPLSRAVPGVVGEPNTSTQGSIDFLRIPLLAATHPTQRRIAATLSTGAVSADFEFVAAAIHSELDPVLRSQDAVLVHNAFTLHFNATFTAALSMMAGDELEGRVVAWTHDIAAINPLYAAEFYPGYPWSLFKKPQAGVRYVAISNTRRDELVSLWRDTGWLGPEPVVVPNGIDPATTLGLSPSIARTAHDLRVFERDMVLLLPVRITRRKNIELAIEVIAHLVERGSDATLLVTGPVTGHHPTRSREYLSELKALAADLGVPDCVFFLADLLGRALKDREIPELFSLSTLLFMPSQSEGFGLPILESALTRLPIVASDIPVFRELAGNDAVYFDLNASIAHITELVEGAVGDKPNRLRTRVLRDYAWDAVYRHHLCPLLNEIAQ